MFSFKYYAENLTLKETIKMPIKIIEGWGITHMRRKIGDEEIIEVYVSNGSFEILVLDPVDWKIRRKIKVNRFIIYRGKYQK